MHPMPILTPPSSGTLTVAGK